MDNIHSKLLQKLANKIREQSSLHEQKHFYLRCLSILMESHDITVDTRFKYT